MPRLALEREASGPRERAGVYWQLSGVPRLCGRWYTNFAWSTGRRLCATWALRTTQRVRNAVGDGASTHRHRRAGTQARCARWHWLRRGRERACETAYEPALTPLMYWSGSVSLGCRAYSAAVPSSDSLTMFRSVGRIRCACARSSR
eukprot:5090423-Pleurochrysis_carterae.AAC.1